jgi:hypothetical protein
MPSGSLALPRVRRRRLPPKALVYLVLTFCVCVDWVGDSVCGFVVGHTSPLGHAVYFACATFQVRWAIVLSRLVRRERHAVGAGEAPWLPSKAHWMALGYWGVSMLILAVVVASSR